MESLKEKKFEKISSLTQKALILTQISLILFQFASLSFRINGNELDGYSYLKFYYGIFVSKTFLINFAFINGIGLAKYFQICQGKFILNYVSYFFLKLKFYSKYFYPFILFHLLYVKYLIPKEVYDEEMIEICEKALPFKFIFISNIMGFFVCKNKFDFIFNFSSIIYYFLIFKLKYTKFLVKLFRLT